MAVSRKRVPLELRECPPNERGALFLVNGRWAYTLPQLVERIADRERVNPQRAREIATTRYPSYYSHFSRCPAADAYRHQPSLL